MANTLKNRPNPLLNDVDAILSEIGDPTISKPILDGIRPTIPDNKPIITPTPDNKPDNNANPSKPDNPNKPDTSTTPDNSTTQPTQQPSTSSPSNPSSSIGLTDEQKRKLARYDKLNVDKLPDDWQSNQKPFDLPATWREQLSQIDDLKQRPTQEQLNNAVLKEANKYKDYDQIKGDLKTWTDIFGSETAQSVKNKLDANKPILTDEEKEAIKNYSRLKKDYDNLKTIKDKEINKLKNEIKIKNAEIDKLRGWKTQPTPNSLVDQINQKIIQAYNSTDYLNGYYEKLMKTFLNWEIAGTEEQKNAVIKTKLNINKCLDFLDNVSKIKNPLITAT